MTIFRVLCCSLAILFLPACAASRNDLVKSGLLTLEPSLTKALTHPPDVYEREGRLVVSGELEPSEANADGHVDVVVVGPDGVVAYSAAVQYTQPSAPQTTGPRGQPRGPRSRAESHSTYSVEFPRLPSRGSVVKVRHDPGAHTGK